MNLSLSLLSLVFISSTTFAARVSEGADLQELFNVRLKLREQFVLGSLSAKEAVQLKAQITKSRYEEDQLGEAQVGNQRRALNEVSPPSFSSGQSTVLNPAIKNLTFQSGDVLLVRGLSTISTTIASVSDSPSQFSHALTIYLDPADQKLYAIEALIGKGTVVHPFAEILNEGLPHIVLYRYKDSALANEAAKIDYERATAAIKAGGTIPYAENLAFDGYDKLTCAKLVRMGFDLASQGAVKMPAFPSTLGKKYPNITKALGFPGTVIPAEWPADFDAQKDLELIAESRDFRATLNFRIKDQIVLSLLDWVEQGSVGHDFSKILAVVKNSPAKSPTANSPEDSAKKMAIFAEKANEVVNALASQVLIANDLQMKKTGLNMSDAQIKDYMGSIRQSPRVEKALRANGFIPKGGSCQQAFL